MVMHYPLLAVTSVCEISTPFHHIKSIHVTCKTAHWDTLLITFLVLIALHFLQRIDLDI